jgi:hypothetical protein
MSRHANYRATRCIDGRTMRHDPQPDDPGLETDIGRCEECGGKGCDVVHREAAEKIAGEKIVTEFVYPPIPDRRFDWSAVTDSYDGAEDSHCPIGYGRSEREAIDDLVAQIEDSR